MRVLLPWKKSSVEAANSINSSSPVLEDEGQEQSQLQPPQQQQQLQIEEESNVTTTATVSTSAPSETAVASSPTLGHKKRAAEDAVEAGSFQAGDAAQEQTLVEASSTSSRSASTTTSTTPQKSTKRPRCSTTEHQSSSLKPAAVAEPSTCIAANMTAGRHYDHPHDDSNRYGWNSNTLNRPEGGEEEEQDAAEAEVSETVAAVLQQQPPLENEPHHSYNYNNNVAVFPNENPVNLRRRDEDPVEEEDDDEEEVNPSDTQDMDSAQLSAFRQALKQRGLEIVEQEGDGNCLFRAVSLQVYGDASMHDQVRAECLDFMAKEPQHFGNFIIDENFDAYIARKRQSGVHGNNPEIQACSELYNRPVEVYTPQSGVATPLNIFHAEYKTSDQPIRLSYHDGNHYNAVIDPLVPTAGLGLGMPGLQPGLADKMQLAKAVVESDEMADQMELKRAVKESQQDEVERVMKESSSSSKQDAVQRALKENSYNMEHMYKDKAIALSDLDATNFELEQTVLESSLESFRRQEHGRKQRASPTAGRRRRAGASMAAATSSSLTEQHSSQQFLPAFSETASAVAAMPSPAAAAIPAVASAAAAAAAPSPPAAAAAGGVSLLSGGGAAGGDEEYPQIVQELVMNGFELAKVIHAYELIGDNFDDLLTFLLSNSK